MQTLLRAVARLPLPLLHLAGGLLGWTLYLASPRYRRHLAENLAQAGYADGAMRRAAIASAGRMLVELPAVWLRTREELNAWIQRIDGVEMIDAARAAGRGVVFLTPHLGCFEILAQAAGERFPITVLYRPPKLAFLQPMIEQGRAGQNVRLAPTDLSGVRQLVAALRAGESVGILPDQVPGEGEGEWADFFGKPAYTMTLAMKLVERPDTEAFLAYGERLAGG
jgi:KDO2-lipid IV(A) lauroyltransferase